MAWKMGGNRCQPQSSASRVRQSSCLNQTCGISISWRPNAGIAAWPRNQCEAANTATRTSSLFKGLQLKPPWLSSSEVCIGLSAPLTL
eukprot:1156079-Pelagomonas_calceolata.AAC.1